MNCVEISVPRHIYVMLAVERELEVAHDDYVECGVNDYSYFDSHLTHIYVDLVSEVDDIYTLRCLLGAGALEDLYIDECCR